MMMMIQFLLLPLLLVMVRLVARLMSPAYPVYSFLIILGPVNCALVTVISSRHACVRTLARLSLTLHPLVLVSLRSSVNPRVLCSVLVSVFLEKWVSLQMRPRLLLAVRVCVLLCLSLVSLSSRWVIRSPGTLAFVIF